MVDDHKSSNASGGGQSIEKAVAAGQTFVAKNIVRIVPDTYPSARAVICILPFAIRKTNPQILNNSVENKKVALEPFGAYVDLSRDHIIIVSDILSMHMSSDKNAQNGTMNATLAPDSDIDYLQLIGPGDYIFSWVVKEEKLDELIEKIKKKSACNGIEFGLKFFGQVQTINESFNTTQNGFKTKRYSLSCASFNFYNGFIYYSPLISKIEGGLGADATMTLAYMQKVDKDIQQDLADKKVDTQSHILRFHKLFVGAGPGTLNKSAEDRTPNGLFGLPQNVAYLLGKNIKADNSADYTVADIMTVLLGVQDFTSDKKTGLIGPNFKLENTKTKDGRSYGLYYIPDDEIKNLKGKKSIQIANISNQTIWNILKGMSNPSLNEMYTTLRMSPTENSEISPTLVCRQLPYNNNNVASEGDKKFPSTPFLTLPRFAIPAEIVMNYSLNRSNGARVNFLTVVMESNIATAQNKGSSTAIQGTALIGAPLAFDPNDVKRHGARAMNYTIDQGYLDQSDTSLYFARSYTNFLTDVLKNMQLKYSGNIETQGIFEPICVGENLEFNDIVFHIESIEHSYQMSGNIPTFRTSMQLSHGTHISNDSEALSQSDTTNLFNEMAPGFQKDSEYPTILAPLNKNTSGSSQTESSQRKNGDRSLDRSGFDED